MPPKRVPATSASMKNGKASLGRNIHRHLRLAQQSYPPDNESDRNMANIVTDHSEYLCTTFNGVLRLEKMVELRYSLAGMICPMPPHSQEDQGNANVGKKRYVSWIKATCTGSCWGSR